MDNLQQFTAFFGWMTVINFGVLILATILLVSMKNFISALHGKLFDIGNIELNTIYMTYLANYKILIFVFNLAPYIALKIISM